MKELTDLPNIGRKASDRIKSIGINTPDDLKACSAVEAIIRLNDILGVGCYSMLYALEGAILGVRWHDLSKEHRKRIKEELDTKYPKKVS